MATKIVYMHGELAFPKLYEDNRDMPEDTDNKAVKKKLEESDGAYTVDLYFDHDKKQEYVEAGLPTEGLQGKLWKEKDGKPYYRVRRRHFNPKANQGEGEILGPPKILVTDPETGDRREHDRDVDGYIGNGSKAIVKISVWNESIIEIQAVSILDLNVYNPDQMGDADAGEDF